MNIEALIRGVKLDVIKEMYCNHLGKARPNVALRGWRWLAGGVRLSEGSEQTEHRTESKNLKLAKRSVLLSSRSSRKNSALGRKLAGIAPFEDIELLEALEDRKDIEDAKKAL